MLCFILILLLVACEKQEISQKQVDVKNENAPAITAAAVVEQQPSIQTLLSNHAPEYTVDYLLNYSGAAGSARISASNYTKDRYTRIAKKTTLAGQNSALYFIDGKGYSCVKQQEWSCNEFVVGEAQEQLPDSSNANPTGERIVAGEKTYCYESILEQRVEYCYTYDAIPLLIRTDSEELLALSFSRIAEPIEFIVEDKNK